MKIYWFEPTLNGLLYLLPTITYIMADAHLDGFPDRKHGKCLIINFVWLYWAIVVVGNLIEDAGSK